MAEQGVKYSGLPVGSALTGVEIWAVSQNGVSVQITAQKFANWIGGAVGGGDASNVSFDPVVTGVTATDVQGAVDEIYGDISTALAAIIGGP